MTTKLEALEAATARESQLDSEIADIRADITRLEMRRDRLAAHGKNRIELPQRHFDARFGLEISVEPLRSLHTGQELAAQVEAGRLAGLREQLSNLERERDAIQADL